MALLGKIPPPHLTGLCVSMAMQNLHPHTSQSKTETEKKGIETDLCCNWQPKSSKGGGRRENSFCPSEGGKRGG